MKQKTGLTVNGYRGTWYIINETIRYGQKLYLLESEIHGDGAACLIVDKLGHVIIDDVYNGFTDYDDTH